MDYESERTRKLGCWDGVAACTGPIDKWTTKSATPDFQPDLDYCDFLIDIGFGKNCDQATREFWRKTIQANYQGDDGRRRARMAAINLRERDGLHGRLFDVKCPVMWLHVSGWIRSNPGTVLREFHADFAFARAPTTLCTPSPTLSRKSSSSLTRLPRSLSLLMEALISCRRRILRKSMML